MILAGSPWFLQPGPGLSRHADPGSIAPQLTIARPPCCSHALPWRARNLVTRWLFVTDEQAGWYPYAVRRATEIIERDSVDAIYTTSTPYTAHLIGLRLKRRFRLALGGRLP